MKKRLIFGCLIVLVIVAIWAGVQLQQRPGYVLIAYQHWTLETPLWLGIVALLVTIILAYIILRFITIAFSVPARWRRRSRQRRQHKASYYTLEGLRQLIEGNSQAADRSLTRARRTYPQVWVNYLAAAVAAQKSGALEQRDAYLQSALQTEPHAASAIHLAAARLHIHQQEWEKARTILQTLQQQKQCVIEVKRLLAKIYEAQHHWTELQRLLPDLHRYSALAPEEVDRLAETTYHHLLMQAIASGSPEQVKRTWQHVIPKTFWQNEPLLNCYVDFLIQQESTEAEHLLRDALKHQWQASWIRRYGLTSGENHFKQLAFAESWLKDHANDPDLLWCLARLCVRQQLWGKARHYFEMSLKFKPTVQVYYEFGELLEQLNEKSAAMTCYRKGLQLAALNHRIAAA